MTLNLMAGELAIILRVMLTIGSENLGPGGPISKFQNLMFTNSSEIKTVRKEKIYGNCMHNWTLL